VKLELTGHVVMPGLINAHDHLEFNLFPRLGTGLYANAGEWARDIYHPDRSPVREHLRIPKAVRLWWGALKNLLSGATTVCHHNPYEPAVFGPDFPVRVVRRFAWAHSLEFEPNIPLRFRRAPKSPFLIHAGEGTDARSRAELAQLDALRVLTPRTAVIHGVAFRETELVLMRRRGSALIWCPTSNLQTLGRTVARTILHSDLPIALATDSAVSAPIDLRDELKVARRYLPAARLREMVTTIPSKILRVKHNDWIAVETKGDPFFTGHVSLVVVRNQIRLISPTLARQLPSVRDFQPLTLEGRPTVLVAADVKALTRAAKRHLGADLYLAGKRVLPC